MYVIYYDDVNNVEGILERSYHFELALNRTIALRRKTALIDETVAKLIGYGVYEMTELNRPEGSDFIWYRVPSGNDPENDRELLNQDALIYSIYPIEKFITQ